MIELVDLSNWKKQSQIIFELHSDWGKTISSRKWRNEVEKWNRKFINGEVDYYITHSSKGFKATRDYKEAKLARDDYMKRAVDMFYKAKQCEKAFIELKNYKMDFETGELK